MQIKGERIETEWQLQLKWLRFILLFLLNAMANGLLGRMGAKSDLSGFYFSIFSILVLFLLLCSSPFFPCSKLLSSFIPSFSSLLSPP